jgi:outer membrane autotransporter protein
MSLKHTQPSSPCAGRKAASAIARDRLHLAPSALVLALSAALALPGTALASDWVGNTTAWTTSGNWANPNAVPGATDDVFINTNTNTAIVSTVGEAVDQLVVGSTAAGALQISNGGTLGTISGELGQAAGANGTVTVTGGGSAWNNLSSIFVGSAGAATLTIQNGGAVTSGSAITVAFGAGSVGAITVDGMGSTLTSTVNTIVVGNGGTGTLDIINGGAVNSVSGAIGNLVNGSGTVTVDASTWTNTGGMVVGGAGTGLLAISGGGVVSNTQGVVGGSGQGTVTVDGAGSKWTNTGDLAVGVGTGTGTLAVTGGAKVSSVNGSIGFAGGSTGTVTIDGNASAWTNTGFMNVGDNGTGTLNILNGATVSVGSTLGVGATAGAVGTVTVDGAGSGLTVGTVLFVGSAGTGALTVSNGASLTSLNAQLGSGANSDGTVTVTGIGSSWTGTGTLSVGESGTGTLLISNGGTVSNGAAGFIGTQAGSSGAVTVDGAGSTWTNNTHLFVGNSGAGTLTITNGGTVSAAGGNTTIGSAAGSSGTLAILGGGTLNSQNSFIAGTAGSTGLATIDGAGSSWSVSQSLSIGEGGTGTLNITNGGVVSNGNLGTIANVGGSTGTVRVDGAGSAWTSNNILAVGGNGDGTLTIANGGAVSAATGVVIAGGATATGTLNIGGAAGAAAAAPGTLTAPTVQFGLGTGALNFNHTDTSGNYTFGAAISGGGTINHNAGWTSLTADSGAFTGQTHVNGGTLAVNNILGGGVNVNAGGTLRGTGLITSAMVNSGAIVAPGNLAMGTLNVVNGITFNAGSKYQVRADAAAQSDHIIAGSAQLNGGTVEVLAGTGSYTPAVSYSILTAGAVNGTFANVTSDLAFLDPSLTYTATDVSLTLTRNNTPIGGVGQTPGQTSTGTAVQSLGSGLGVGSAVLSTLLGLSAPQARRALEQLSGEVHASARGVQMQDSHFSRDASLDRLRALDSEIVANDGGAGEEGKARLLPSVRDLAYWARAMGSWGHLDGSGGSATVNRDTSGFMMGADTRFGEEGRFGLAGGYSRSSFDVADRSSSGSSDNYHLGAYAGSRWGDLALRTGLSYSWHDVSTSRVVAYPGFIDSLKADYKASTTQAFAELGYRIKTERAELEPFANLAHVNVSSDGFAERGGPAALTSAGNSDGVTFSTLGLRASTKVAMSGGADVTARGAIGWRHAFGGTAPTNRMTFAVGTPLALSFDVTGAPVARNVASVEAGLDFKLTNAATLGISYAGQFGSGLKDHGARVNLNVAF